MKPSTAKPLLAMLPVRNEAGRYLKTVLKHLSEFADGIVILDDASTDETPDLCRNHPGVVSYHRLNTPLFCSDEAALRRKLWEMTVKFEPAWILAIDADEIFESGIKRDLPALLNQDQFGLYFFTVIHFWGDLTHYRVDGIWDPAISKLPCLCRFRKNNDYHWPDRKLHCGRFPIECYSLSWAISKIRLLHLGYADHQEHLPKFRRYLSLDPEGKFCPLSHYQSIIAQPNLKHWTGERLEKLL